MTHRHSSSSQNHPKCGFTLIEVLVVIAIIAILLTVGAVGLGNISGKGVTSGVDSAEAIFDEARSLAVAEGVRTAVLVARELDNNSAEDRRRILVAKEQTNADGSPTSPNSATPNWVLTSRGSLLPEKTFYSEQFSYVDHQSASGDIATIESSQLVDAKSAFAGSYFIYQFSSQGIPWDPTVSPTNHDGALSGMSFTIGSGTRQLNKPATTHPPRVTGSARRDFGGFVIWKNGRTSVFRSPDQINQTVMQGIKGGDPF